MSLEIVVGTQWGDEGKGRIVDLLAARRITWRASTAATTPGIRYSGEQTFKLHLVPSSSSTRIPSGRSATGW